MRKLFLAVLALSLVAAPTAATAKPTKTDRHNAAKECRAERGTTDATREAFRDHYGTNKNKKNAFGKCVSSHAKDEARERKAAKKAAKHACKVERDSIGRDAFADKYGTNKNKKNAFGKCVSGKVKAALKAADKADSEHAADRRGAAKGCATEREAIGSDAFAEKYGTNKNKKNAFGKCVSAGAKARGKTRSAAEKRCTDERAAIGSDAFAEKYGTNKNKKNAFGRCVAAPVSDEVPV